MSGRVCHSGHVGSSDLALAIAACTVESYVMCAPVFFSRTGRGGLFPSPSVRLRSKGSNADAADARPPPLFSVP